MNKDLWFPLVCLYNKITTNCKNQRRRRCWGYEWVRPLQERSHSYRESTEWGQRRIKYRVIASNHRITLSPTTFILEDAVDLRGDVLVESTQWLCRKGAVQSLRTIGFWRGGIPGFSCSNRWRCRPATCAWCSERWRSPSRSLHLSNLRWSHSVWVWNAWCERWYRCSWTWWWCSSQPCLQWILWLLVQRSWEDGGKYIEWPLQSSSWCLHLIRRKRRMLHPRDEKER